MWSAEVDDRTARARIRDAAVARFAAAGFSQTSVRVVAADAGVSPALVLHHFGSKEGLRQACDDHVVSEVARLAEPILSRPTRPGALSDLLNGASHLTGYVRRALVEGGDGTAALVDRFVDVSERLLAEGESHGTVTPSGDPRARAASVVLWDLAALVLGEHLRRVLREDDERAALDRYGAVVADVYINGLFRQPAADASGQSAQEEESA